MPEAPPSHPFAYNPRSRQHRIERAGFWALRLATYAIIAAGGWVFLTIVFNGAQTVFQLTPPFVNVEFLFDRPQTLYVFDYEGESYELADHDYRDFLAAEGLEPAELDADTYAYAGGGIFPAIVGTILLVIGSMTIALVLGVLSAIYLSEYARDSRYIRLIRLAIVNLAGVPSIVFGLFGMGMFVLFLNWGVSLLAGWFTLAFMVLPIVITASEEALRAVPPGFREGSLALGASKWQAIRTNVLPYALPGILTSSILSIARVAGETAPIMFTVAYAIRDEYPWQVDRFSEFFLQGVMALPYHIYIVSTKIPESEYASRMQYGSAFVFLAIVLSIAIVSIILRQRTRRRYRL